MLPTWYNQYKKLIDKSIKNYLDIYFNNLEIDNNLNKFKEAIYYSVKWWKRIRSILAIEFYLIISNKKIENIKFWDNIILYCIAIELLHAYSLVHDDLPAIDNDTIRRWEETTWKKYWETNAILVWDLLNTLTFEILGEIWNVSLLKEFSKATWFNWMIWWQVLDIYYENNNSKLNIDKLINVHNKKTWKLIEVSIVWWLILWNLSLDKKNKIKKSNIIKYIGFWKKIWLAFQVKDDLLDVEWSLNETWKSVWWENKWFVHFIWIKESREYLNNLIDESLNIISKLKSEKLNFLVSYIWTRKK